MFTPPRLKKGCGDVEVGPAVTLDLFTKLLGLAQEKYREPLLYAPHVIWILGIDNKKYLVS